MDPNLHAVVPYETSGLLQPRRHDVPSYLLRARESADLRGTV